MMLHPLAGKWLRYAGKCIRPRSAPSLKFALVLMLAVTSFALSVKEASAQITVTLGTGTSTSAFNTWIATSTTTNRYSKSANIYTAAEILAAGGSAGQISTLRFEKGTGEYTFNDATLEIFMKAVPQATHASTSLTWATEVAGATQVYATTTQGFTGGAGWIELNLTTPFTWNGTDNIEILTDFYRPNSPSASVNWLYTSVTNAGAITYSASPVTTMSRGSNRANIQMVFVPNTTCSGNPTPGTAAASVSTICPGTTLVLSLSGQTVAAGIEVVWQSSPTGAAGTFTDIAGATSISFSTTQTSTTYYRAKVTCNGANEQFSNSVEVITPAPFAAGTYTIDQTSPASATNFISFAAAINAIDCGIAGPVTFNVVPGSGPYIEQVLIPEIGGAGPASRVTFNGNGETVRHTATASSDIERFTVRLDGADYITLEELNVEALGTTYGWGIHLGFDADFNELLNNTITIASTSATAANSIGIIASGSNTSGTVAGQADNNLIQGNTVAGGYANIQLTGNGTTLSTGNQVIGNIVTDYYSTGIDIDSQDGAIIKGNDISRPTRTSTITSYGINLSGNASQNNKIEGNSVHDISMAIASNSSTNYGIAISTVDPPSTAPNRVINNKLYNLNLTGNGPLYVLYTTGSDYAHFYHNSVSINDPAATSTGATRGFYQTAIANGVEFVNNIIRINRGGTGVKTAIYLNENTSTITSNNNVLSIASPSATDAIGYYEGAGAQATLTDWKAVNSNAFDQQSIDDDPQFVNAAAGNLTPGNPAVDNIGTPVGVLTDINGDDRITPTPDPGAYEFTIPVSCAAPIGLTAGNITDTQATITWNVVSATGEFSLIYDVTGFDPLTGGNNISAISDLFFTLTPLLPNTTYDVYVMQECPTGNSTLSGPVVFTTPCSPISVFPYQESFSTVTAPDLPCSWTQVNANTDANAWASYATTPITATNSASVNRATNQMSDDWLFSQSVQLTGGITYRLSFDYKVSTVASEDIDVYLATAQDPTAVVGAAFYNNTNLNSLTPLTVGGVFTPATTGIYYIAWHANTPVTTGAVRLYIDDIDLRVAPQNDAFVQNIYTYGRMPVPFAAPHSASASIVNTGVAPFTNKDVTLTVTGPGGFSFTNTQTIASLAPDARTVVTFAGYTPTAAGNYTVTVSVPADEDTSNDSQTMTQEVTTNAYSYKYPGINNVTGVGVGFTNGTGILAAKFFTANPQSINQVKVDFLGSGQPYEIVIFDANGPGGLPGNILHTSTTLTTVNGTALIPIIPSVPVTGNFAIGVRQVGTTNMLFAFQEELPIRTGTFFSGNTAGTTWTDFAANNSRFRFAVEVELELPATTPPNCAVLGAPNNNATAQQTIGTLNFTSGGGSPTGFKVYLSANQADVTDELASALVSDQTTLNYDFTGLSGATVYYWKVVPYNTIGPATGCTVRQFTTRNVDIVPQALINPTVKFCYTNAEQVSVSIRNAGTGTHDFTLYPTTVTVNVTTPTGTQVFTETVNTGTLTASTGATTLTVNMPGTLDMTSPGIYTFEATVSLPSESNTTNNTTTFTRIVGPMALPLAPVDFTGFTGANLTDVFPGWTEATGAANTTIAGSNWVSPNASQTTAFTTVARINMAGSVDRASVVSPIVAVTSNTRVFFDLGMSGNALTSPSANGMTGTDDELLVRVSADCGVSWTTVMTFNAANQPSNGSLGSYVADLSAFAGQGVLVGFYANEGTTTSTSYDLLLDNIEIRNVVGLDLGATALVTPVQQDCNTTAEQVTVEIRNLGALPIDFSVNNARVLATVTGPGAPQTVFVDLTSNALNGGAPLADGATLVVPVGTVDLSAPGTYTFVASTEILTNGPDQQPANDAIAPVTLNSVVLASGTAIATPNELCFTGTPTLILTNYEGVGTITWQHAATFGGTYTDIANSNSASFTLLTPITQTTWFRAKVSCGTATDFSNESEVVVNTPAITTTNSPVNVCAPGTVTLNATGNGDIQWFTAATGGTPIATGNTYSPTVAANTTYYVQAGLSAQEGVGMVNGAVGSSFLSQTKGWGLRFTATEPITINHVYVYPTGTGTISVEIQNETTPYGVLYAAAPVAISGTGSEKILVPVNLTIPAGTYVMGMASTGITNLVRNSSGSSFPYTSPSGVVSILNGANATASGTTSAYYWFYDWSITAGCSSPRQAVQVNVNTPPTVGVTASQSICAGQQVTLEATGADTYLWSNGETTSSITVTPTANTTYEVTGTTSGCTGTASSTVTVNPAIVATAGSNSPVTAGNNIELSASGGTAFSWTGPNGFASTDQNPTITSVTTVNEGIYTVSVSDGTCSATATVTVTVNTPALPLNGTYTIDQNSPASATNFISFTAAANWLNTLGVSGPVTINVVAGTGPYSEQFWVGQIPGSSSTNTVTLNGNNQVLTYCGTATSRDLVRLDGTDNLTLDGLVLNATCNHGWGIHMVGDVSNLTLTNNTINLLAATSTFIGHQAGIVATNSDVNPQIAGGVISGLTVSGNQVTNGYYGIRIQGAAAATPAAGVVVTNNTLAQTVGTGIDLRILTNPTVTGNQIAMRVGPGYNFFNSTGLIVHGTENGLTVTRNKVTNAGSQGLYLGNVNVASTTRGTVANNLIGGGFQNANLVHAVQLNNASYLDVHYNSTLADNGAAGSGMYVSNQFSRFLNMQNNSFAFTGASGYALQANNGNSNFSTIDNNNYYTGAAGPKFVRFGGADRANLSDLQTAPGPANHNMQSMAANPLYVSTTDLHLQAGSPLIGQAAMLASVSVDYDGDARTSPTDIGADEYTVTLRTQTAGLNAEVYPNPFHNTLTVKLAAEAGQVQVTLTDLMGRQVLSQQYGVEAGATQLQVSVEQQIAQGVYLLQVTQGGATSTFRVVKQ